MSNQQILLVESDPKQLRLVRASLEQAGYAVTTADDGKAALTALESESFDLVLSATSLPRLDGFELVELMQEHASWQEIPVVLMIDGDVRAARMRGVRLGIEEFLTKPVFVKEMVARVRVLLAKQVRERLSNSGTAGNLNGSLDEISVIDLLESIEKGRQSGSAVFRVHSTTATVYFRQGEIVDATLKRLRGEEAVLRLLSWREGRYDVTLGPSARAAVVELDTRALLEMGVRQAEEFHALAETLPPLDSILEVDFTRLRELADDVPDSIEALLRLFDGKRTLFEVVDDSPFDDRSTLRTLQQLFDEGILLAADSVAEQPVPLSRASAAGNTLRPTSDGAPSAVRLGRSEAPPVNLSVEEPEPEPEPDASEVVPAEAATQPEPLTEALPDHDPMTHEDDAAAAAPVDRSDDDEVAGGRQKKGRKGKRGKTAKRGKEPSAARPFDEPESLRSASPPPPRVEVLNAPVGSKRPDETRSGTLRVTASDAPPRDSLPSPVRIEEGDTDEEAELLPGEGGVANVFFSHPPPSMSEDGRPQHDVDEDDGEIYLTDDQLDRRAKNRKLVIGLIGVMAAVGAALIFVPSLGGAKGGAATATKSVAPRPILAPSATSAAASSQAPQTAPSAATTVASAPSEAASAAPSASAATSAEVAASAAPVPAFLEGETNLPEVADPLKAAMKKLDVGNYNEAILFAKAAIKKEPDNADGYFALFTAYDSIGKAPDATKVREACAANATKGQYKGYCPTVKPVKKKKR